MWHRPAAIDKKYDRRTHTQKEEEEEKKHGWAASLWTINKVEDMESNKTTIK